MVRYTTRLFAMAVVAFLALSVRPAEGAKGKTFVDSDDAKEKDEPAKFLPDYDKLTKGKDADWVYFPEGSLKKYRTVSVKEFEENGRGREARDAAREGRDYMEQWLDKQGFKVVKSGGGHRRRRQRLQRVGAPRRRAVLGRLGRQPGRRGRSAREGQPRQRRGGSPAEIEGIVDAGRGRERPRGGRQVDQRRK